MNIKKGIRFSISDDGTIISTNGFSVNGITAYEDSGKVIAIIQVELNKAKVTEIDLDKPDLTTTEMFLGFEATSTFKVELAPVNNDLKFTYIETTQPGGNKTRTVTGTALTIGFGFTKVGPQSGDAKVFAEDKDCNETA